MKKHYIYFIFFFLVSCKTYVKTVDIPTKIDTLLIDVESYSLKEIKKSVVITKECTQYTSYKKYLFKTKTISIDTLCHTNLDTITVIHYNKSKFIKTQEESLYLLSELQNQLNYKERFITRYLKFDRKVKKINFIITEKMKNLDISNDYLEFIYNDLNDINYKLEIELSEIKRYNDMPLFPWPPPKASATIKLPAYAFKKANTLFDVDEILDLALTKNGYFEKSYYYIPNGFAIASQLEQINEDATSKNPPDRWKTQVEMNDFSFSDYITSIFFTKTGYFRIIVFIVTDIPYNQSKVKVDRETAMSWVSDGTQILAPSMREMPFTKNYYVTALIYEYELPENSKKAILQKPSDNSGHEHLLKAGLWKEIIKK